MSKTTVDDVQISLYTKLNKNILTCHFFLKYMVRKKGQA